ncbi:MAG TPA: ankyrin repeat domain-containing protein [Verrucomicrobiae bacterium]|nr:ankyrin repeat domain-containing protein [Verrucomicrobiae bacterium]
MKTIKVSFILCMLVVSAFVMIYVGEGFYESLPVPSSQKAFPSLPEAGPPKTLFTRVKDMLRPSFIKKPAPEPEPAAAESQAEEKTYEVHHGLCVAAMTGDLAKTRELLDAGVSANARDSFGIRAIARATLWGHYDVVKILLEKGADVNEKERLGVSLLMLAANQGDEKLLELFLEHGADVNIKSEDGETALSTAAKKGFHEIVDRLKQAGAKEEPAPKREILKQTAPEKKSPIPSHSPTGKELMEARKSAAPKKMENVVRNRPARVPTQFADGVENPPQPLEAALPPAEGDEASTPSLDALTWAANISQESISFDEENMAREAEEKEAAPVETSSAPVSAAAKKSVPPVKAGIPEPQPVAAPALNSESSPQDDVELESILKDLRSLRVADIAPKAPKAPEMFSPSAARMPAFPGAPKPMLKPQEMKKAPAAVQAQHVPAMKPMAVAPIAAPKKKVQEAIVVEPPQPLPPLPTSLRGNKPLKKAPLAPAAKKAAAVPMKKKVHEMTFSKSHHAPEELLRAALIGTPESVQSLISQGLDVNIRGDLEMTPLMLAAQDGRLEVVKLLLQHGADVNAQNIVGQTALRLASLKEHHDVMLHLRQYGAKD